MLSIEFTQAEYDKFNQEYIDTPLEYRGLGTAAILIYMDDALQDDDYIEPQMTLPGPDDENGEPLPNEQVPPDFFDNVHCPTCRGERCYD